MLALLARVAVFVITSASGWLAADIYNEKKELQQAQAQASIIEAAKGAAVKHKSKWIFLAIASVVGFAVIRFVILPLFAGKRGNVD